MQSWNQKINQLKLAQKSIKEQSKDLRTFEKRTLAIIKVENEYRLEMLEYLYTIAYPRAQLPKVAGRPGCFQIPSIARDKARTIEKKNEKVERAV